MSDLDVLLGTCRAAVLSVDPVSREKLVDGILTHRKVFIYGSGRSGLVGQMFAVRLVQLGLDVHFVGEMTTPIIGREDLTLLISYTGRTSSVVQTAEIARRIGSDIFCVTGVRGSPLTLVSGVSLIMTVPEGEDVKRTAPLGTVFEDSAMLLFDGIVSEIMSREGITETEMRNRHAIWVRSLGQQCGGHAAPVVVHQVDGHLAGDRVYHDEDPGPNRRPDGRDHLLGGAGALGREEHPDLGPAYPGDRDVPAVDVGLPPACEPPVRRGPLCRVRYGGHGV